MTEFYKTIDEIGTRAEFLNFLNEMIGDLVANPENWENTDLRRYLEALAAWLEDTAGQEGRAPNPDRVGWDLFAESLWAAAAYE